MKNDRGIRILIQNCPGNDAELKIIKIVPGHDTHMTNTPGAHEKISPDQYFEYVESSGRDPAPRYQGEPEGMTRRASPLRVIFLTGGHLAQHAASAF